MAKDRKNLNAGPIDVEILQIAERITRAHGVKKFLRVLVRAEQFEKTLSKHGKAEKARRDDPALSMARQSTLDHLITSIHETLDPVDVFGFLVALGDMFGRRGELISASEMFTRALTHAAKMEDKGFTAEAHLKRGEISGRLSQWESSADDLQKSREIYKSLKEPIGLGRAENILASNLTVQGELAEAEKVFGQALAAFTEHDEVFMQGTVLMNLGIVNNIIGNHDVALTNYQRARSVFEELGDLVRIAQLHHNSGMTYLSLGAFEDALREFDRASELGKRTGDTDSEALATLGKATALYYLKDFRMSMRLVNRAIDSFAKSGDRLSVADAYKVKGMIHREMKKLEYAESYFRTSIRINMEYDNTLNCGESYFELGLLEKKRKNREKAREAFQSAYGCFKKVGARFDMERTEQAMEALA